MCGTFCCNVSYCIQNNKLHHQTYNVSSPIGNTRYGPVDYTGTMYVKASSGSDYIGVVFGYQTNRKFYVVMWRKENINYAASDINAGIKGLQLKVIEFRFLGNDFSILIISRSFNIVNVKRSIYSLIYLYQEAI